MSLDEEIQRSAKEIFTDGYEMSIGELMSLYKDNEMIINPDFQRYFRWNISQKTKFIESILLGIPIPPIFVFQTQDGVWELIDGLQRLSTIFEFVGILKRDDGTLYEPTVLEGTQLLPSLSGKKWEPLIEEENSLTKPQQLSIRRSRMRVEILKKESDQQSKYELFQRLNTGGSSLTEQEVRNCIMIMVNRDFYRWIVANSEFQPFKHTVAQTENAERIQRLPELTLRFFVYRNIPYHGRLDVNEYLDSGMLEVASNPEFDYRKEEEIFQTTFSLIDRALGENAFKRFDNNRFLGQFTFAAFEVVSVGISKNLSSILSMTEGEQDEFIIRRTTALWGEAAFRRNSGAGVRGTTRLANLLPMGELQFRPD